MTWGLPTTWVSFRGYTDMDALIVLYLGGIWWGFIRVVMSVDGLLTPTLHSWSIYYDTIYACQDRRDDIKAGVKSTAVLFGDYVRPIVSVFATLFVASLVYAGMVTEAGPLYYVITVGGGAACFAWQMLTIDFDNGEQCWSAFKVSASDPTSIAEHSRVCMLDRQTAPSLVSSCG